MSLKDKIQSLLKHAELYKSQSLIDEAREKYEQVKKLINSQTSLKNKEELLLSIDKKINALQQESDKIFQASSTKKDLSPQVQDLIKKLFSFSKDQAENIAALDGAIALAKFGQFERALNEFRELLIHDDLRFDAAKNIVKCYTEQDKLNEAIEEYKTWETNPLFSEQQKDKLRIFLQNILDKKGINQNILPTTVAPAPVEAIEEGSTSSDEEMLDISSIGIRIESGPRQGEKIEVDVSFQSGNIVSLIISSRNQDLIDSLNVGLTLKDIDFYSPIAIFKGSGLITAKSKIDSGPKKGDYCVDLKIVNI
ncbi:MAG: hypothetical protein HQK77_05755 [Desulfobacterales bacterium]|nr:hypothetical protein [Desulfobacterales bacterium]